MQYQAIRSSGANYSFPEPCSTDASDGPNELHCVVLRCVATASERIRKSVIMSTLTFSYQSCLVIVSDDQHVTNMSMAVTDDTTMAMGRSPNAIKLATPRFSARGCSRS